MPGREASREEQRLMPVHNHAVLRGQTCTTKAKGCVGDTISAVGVGEGTFRDISHTTCTCLHQERAERLQSPPPSIVTITNQVKNNNNCNI